MDQQTQNEVQALKAELYDNNKSIQQQANIIMSICDILEVPVNNGLDVDALMEAVRNLKEKGETE